MKPILFFCLALAAPLHGGERAPATATPRPPRPAVHYVARNLVMGVADTTIIADSPSIPDKYEQFLRAKLAAGRRLAPFATTVNAAPTAVGTGVIISPSGYALTAAHVVEAGGRIEVITIRGQRPATCVALDRGTDLALLKLPPDTYTALPLASGAQTRVGHRVAAIGFPRPEWNRIQPRLLRGEITAARDEWGNAGTWKLNVATERGESGAPVIDESGRVVGIVQRAVEAWSVPLGETLPSINTSAEKSSYAWPLLDCVDPFPLLPAPATAPRPFEDIVATAEQAVVLVMIYAPRSEAQP